MIEFVKALVEMIWSKNPTGEQLLFAAALILAVIFVAGVAVRFAWNYIMDTHSRRRIRTVEVSPSLPDS
jgi:hypothetical protein